MLRILAVFMMALAGGLGAESLSRDAYLTQVQQGNRGFKAMQGTETALKLAVLEPKTMLSPYLSGQVAYFDDQAEPAISFMPQRTTATNWQVDVSKQFSLTGSRLSLGYKGQNQALLMPSFSTGSLDNTYFNQQGFSVTLVQPLLKDFGASGYDILQRKADAQIGSARFWNRHGAASTLFEAETAYIQVAVTRQIMALLEESLARNQKILDWTKDKYNDNLADKVDVLQVEAASKQAELGIAQTRQELKSAEERFNTLRGVSPGAGVEALIPLQAPSALPARAGERADVKAASLDAVGKEVLADEVTERYFPQLDLIGSAVSTGGDAPDPGNTMPPDHPTYTVALKLTTILDLPLYMKVIDAAKQAASVGADDLAQKRLKEEQDWGALTSQWAAVQDSLKLAEALEAVQKEKAEREKKRYLDGRTTNFQVLRFDEDYNQARINSLRLQVQAAILAAQANFYNGGGIQW